ncbi:MAG: alpha/beta hydrolase [Dehalococcoidia bacterium]|nr:alpha/beta hydrolase [Dehalococcoidia bacterium]
MKRAYVDTPDGQIHYVFDGVGEPLILLHHAGSSSVEFQKVIPLLSSRFRVLALDMLGHGNSDHPKSDPLIDDYVRVLMNFMGALKLDKAIIVGNHTGTDVAVKLAALHPEYVRKLVIYGVLCRNRESREKLDKEELRKPYPMQPDGGHILKVWQSERRFSSDAISLESLTALVAESLRAYKGASADHRACHYNDSKEDLPLIKCPTLIIKGTLDPLSEDADRALALTPHSELAVIQGGTPHVPLERPQEFAEAILSFLDRN